MRRAALWLGILCALARAPLLAAPAAFDAATAFGARPDVAALRLSPDGNNVAFIVPVNGAGSAVKTLSLAPGAKAKTALYAGGKPDRITGCDWVSNDRLVCQIYWIGPHPDLLPFRRLVAVDADGGNLKSLSKPKSSYTRGVELGGGEVIDWLPEQDGAVLMGRISLPDDHVGTRLASDKIGFGVDRLDTRTLASTTVQQPMRDAIHYLSDGHGTLRIMAERVPGAAGYESGLIRYSFRARGTDQWQTLCSYNEVEHSGFLPLAVDRDLDVAYGFKKKDGRLALYTLSLDGKAQETLVYARDDVDVDRLMRVGRHRRVVGVSYATGYRQAKYTDAAIENLAASLERALSARSGLRIVDSSVDESKLLIYSSADVDAGVYYLFDRAARQLQTFLVVRSPLEGVTLAKVQPMSYPTKDGTSVPAYLTLPPGKDGAKRLPAIVLPHGGPSYRDEWGFDWLPQYFAAQGYVVLQPNFRGSSGYGDAWFQDRGFKSWQVAIGDILDAGHWLVAQGIADPDRLAVVGWSYGGYAALHAGRAHGICFGLRSGRGYDDVAFLNGKVYLSYTNPVNPTDPVLQMLGQGNSPSGTLTTTTILTAQQTNPLFTSASQNPPDTDSLRTTPDGKLVLTSEGDGLGAAFNSSDGRYTLISNPGTAQQTLTNVRVTNSAAVNVNKRDDVVFPGATAGMLYVSDTTSNTVYAIHLTGLDPNTPIVTLGSFDQVALVNPLTGVVGTPLLSDLGGLHGLEFVAATPEPSTWALLLLGLGGVALAAAGRRKSGAPSWLAAAN